MFWSYLDDHSTRFLARMNVSVMNTGFVQAVFACYLKVECFFASSLLFWVLGFVGSIYVVYNGIIHLEWYGFFLRIVIFFSLLCVRMRQRFLSVGSTMDEELNENDLKCKLCWSDIISHLNENIQHELRNLGIDDEMFIKNNLPLSWLSAMHFDLKKVKKSKLAKDGTTGVTQHRQMHRAGGSATREMGETVYNWYRNNPDEAAKAAAATAIVIAGGITYGASQYVQLTGQAAVNESIMKLNEAQAQSSIIVAESEAKVNEALAKKTEAETESIQAGIREKNAQSAPLEQGTLQSTSGKWFFFKCNMK